jgi:hypothetical protein
MPEKIPNNTAVDAVDNKALGESLPYNPFSYHYQKISSHTSNKISSVANAEVGDIRVALVCLNTSTSAKEFELVLPSGNISTHIEKTSLKRNLHHHANENQHLADYKLALEKAAENLGAHIICINELGFPTENKIPSEKAIEITKEIVKRYKCIVIAGSYHDSRTMYNSGHVYYPKDDPQTPVDFHFCYKQVSAKELTANPELINIPPMRTSVSIQAFRLNIAVIICLDLLDYSSIAPLINPSNNINLIVVPSYTDNMKPMKRVAEQMSKVLPGGVFINNACIPGSGESAGMYLFGEEIKNPEQKDGDKMTNPDTQFKYYQIYPLPDQKGKICLYSINYDQFLRDKNYHFNNGNPDLKWLFGLPWPQKYRLH